MGRTEAEILQLVSRNQEALGEPLLFRRNGCDQDRRSMLGDHHGGTWGCTVGQSKKGARSTWRDWVTPILPPCSLLSFSSLLCPVRAAVTLPVAPAKPAAPLGPLGEGSKAPASLCQHDVLQSLPEIPGATETRAHWDVPCPGRLLHGALPSGYASSQKLTGKVHAGEHGGIPAGCGGTGRSPAPKWLRNVALEWGRRVGMARSRRHSSALP